MIYTQSEINQLKRLLQSGLMADVAPNALKTLSDFQDVVPGEGNFAALKRGTGVVQSTNPDGSQNQPIYISEDTPQPTMRKVIGYGGGVRDDLGTESAAPAPIDYSRGSIEIPGVGKALYGKDGNAYTQDGTKIILGYNRDATRADESYRMAKQKFDDERKAAAADLAYKTQQTAASKAAMEYKEKAKPIWDADRGMFVDPETMTAYSVTGEDGKPLGAKPTKPTEGYMKQQAGVANVINALDAYKGALSNWGASDVFKPDTRANIESLYNNAMLQAKEAYNLGVLNGPDFQILTQTLTQPWSMKGAITSNDALLKQVDTVKDRMRAIGAGSAQAHGQGQQAQDAGGIPPGAISYLRANPQLRAAFDAKYGNGASSRVLGM